MGNQMRTIVLQCRNCFKTVKREISPNKIEQNKVHQLVDLSKNPSSDVSVVIDHRLSFAIENHADQSFDSCKIPKSPEDGDTSITISSALAQKNKSPSKIQTVKQLKIKPFSSKSDQRVKGGLKSEANVTEESPMLQEELKSQPTTVSTEQLSVRERMDIPQLESSDTNNLISVGQIALKQFDEIIKEIDGFGFLYSFESIVLRSKDYQTEEKYNITQLKYSYQLNTTLEKFKIFQNDVEQQKLMEPSLEVYNVISQDDKYKLIMLRQKKIMFLDPKEYYYVKYCETDDDVYTEVCKSVNMSDIVSPGFQQSKRIIQRGQIYLAGIKVQEIADHIEIEGYMEVNLKLKLPPFMTNKQLCSEFKDMVERQSKHFMNQ